jgi:S-adenosylmethionine-diacylgycerolhomoserine-N-methlytransferase
MDGIYRYQRYIYDATRKYYLLGRDHLLDELKPPAGGTILEIGCGTGRNLVLAARRYPQARLFGFDISEMMLETARSSIGKAGLAGRVTVARGDATAFDTERLFGTSAFDRVFISYTLSMVPPWRDVLRPAIRAVAQRGRLHIVDFGQQEGYPRIFKSALYAWLAKFTVYPRAELEAELDKACAETPGATLSYQRLYRGYADYAVVTRAA